MADCEIAIHIVLIATLQSSLTLHFYGTHIYTLTVKVNSICCIQNPLQGLNTKRRRGAKLQICWKILYLRGQQGCVWHLCLGIPKSQGCEEMKFQSKCKVVLYRRTYHILSLGVLVLPSGNAPTPLDQSCFQGVAQSWTLVVCREKDNFKTCTLLYLPLTQYKFLWCNKGPVMSQLRAALRRCPHTHMCTLQN